MFRGKIITIIIALLAVAMPVAASDVSVGPLDGKSGPALRPLSNPTTTMAVEVLPGSADVGLPKELERLGDLSAAALEWQRIAYENTGAQRDLALTNATRLQIALGHPDVAAAILSELLTENPATPYAPEALYHIASGPVSPAQVGALKQLHDTFAGNPWANAALLNDVWQQAEKGKITETYNLKPAEELKARIKTLHLQQQEKIAKAGALGVVLPGAGHAYAGNIPQGLTVLMVWCLFTLAFLSACRHRHYAYSFLFVIPAAALWLSSPVVAMQLVRDETQKKLEKSLTQWSDLRPQLPSNPTTPNPKVR